MSVLLPSTATSDSSTSGFDALLGAARDRYLGDGHRRVALSMSDLLPVDASTFSASASISYPKDWSTKAGQERSPHLSTVDALRIVGVVMNSPVMAAHLANGYTLERSLTIRAGARPWEDLARVPISTSLREAADRSALLVQHTIGSLRVDSEWVPSADRPTVADTWEAGTASEIQLLAGSRVRCTYERRTPAPEIISLLEAMMLTAQMSQVALYQGDAERRNRSGNMWMRRAGFVRDVRQWRRTAPVEVELLNERQLLVGGQTIRTAEVLARDVFGVQVTASLATGS
jgi:hypothetical protein